MAGIKYPAFDTLTLHAGAQPDPATGARATPIYQSASFVFRDSDQAASLFNIERTGHVYSRLSNPTNAVLEERIAALEGGIGAIATASGQAALHLAIVTLMGAGSHIVAARSLYGGSHNLLAYTLPRFGIETTFVDARDPEAFRCGNPPRDTAGVCRDARQSRVSKCSTCRPLPRLRTQAGLPLLVDATFTTPYLMQPLQLGADLVIHSATKFLSGHGIVIGGLLVDGGSFDWDASGKFPTLSEPYAGFHGLVFSEEFGPAAFITRARKEGMRDFGACMSPTSAFHVLQGIETLGLRMQRHVDNTRRVVAFLAGHEQVESIGYPELEGHPDHALASRLLPRGCGAVFSFEIKGGRAAGSAFVDALDLFSHLANVGDAKSLVIHPASTTHHRMDAQALAAAGIGPGTIRLSVGLEDPADLIDDLKQGMRAAAKASREHAS